MGKGRERRTVERVREEWSVSVISRVVPSSNRLRFENRCCLFTIFHPHDYPQTLRGTYYYQIAFGRGVNDRKKKPFDE
jgi:hypothetical protein